MKKRAIRPGLMAAILIAGLALGSGAHVEAKGRRHPKRKPASKSSSSPGSAGKAAKLAFRPEEPSPPQPIDALMENLRSGPESGKGRKKTRKKPKPAAAITALSHAQRLLEEGKLGEAYSLASGFEKDSTYGDHAIWIAGSSLQAQALVSWSKGSGKQAEQGANKAGSLFRKIVEKFPYSPHSRNALREAGRSSLIEGAALCDQRKWTPCKAEMEEGLQRLSSSSDLHTIGPELVESFVKACAQRTDELCTSWVYRLAQVYSRGGPEYKVISKYAGSVIERMPPPSSSARVTKVYKAPDADQVAFDAAYTSAMDQKWSAAAKAFRQFLDDFPRSGLRFRARFWLAYSVSQDKKDEAKPLYAQLLRDTPLSYYGLISALSTGQLPEAALVSTAPQATTRDPYLYPSEVFRLKRAEKLISAKAYSLAAIDLKDLRAHEGLSNPFLVYLASLQAECGNHPAAFSILSELIGRGYEGAQTQYTLKLIFPTTYLDLIDKLSKDSKLDPLLVLSLVKQESAFDHGAISGTGARGLMQLMPATFSEVAPDAASDDMAKAEQNLRAGTKYLAKLLARYNGNMIYALAAYNAGLGNVDRWLKNTAVKRGMIEFIESIPFRETREYVSSIVRNYYWYTRRIRNETPAIASLWNAQHGPAPAFPALGQPLGLSSPQPPPKPQPDANSNGKAEVKSGEEPPLPPVPPSPAPEVMGPAAPSPKPSPNTKIIIGPQDQVMDFSNEE